MSKRVDIKCDFRVDLINYDLNNSTLSNLQFDNADNGNAMYLAVNLIYQLINFHVNNLTKTISNLKSCCMCNTIEVPSSVSFGPDQMITITDDFCRVTLENVITLTGC